MVNKELSDLIKKQIEAGSSKAKIISDLIFAGWQYREIESAFVEMFESNEISLDFWAANEKIKPRTTLARPDFSSVSKSLDAEEEAPSGAGYFFRRNKFLLGLILGFIFFIGGLGLGWRYFYLDSPEIIIQKSFNNFAQVKTLAFNSSIKKGDQNIAKINGTLDLSSQKRSAQVAVFDQDKQESDFSIIQLPNSSFVQIQNLPSSTPIESKYMSKWILVNSEFQEIGDLYPALKNFSAKAPVLAAQITKDFGSLKVSPSFFNNIDDLGQEQLGNYSFHHFKIIPSADFSNFVLSRVNALASFGNFVPDNLSGTWDIWVEDSTYLPYKIIISGISNSEKADSVQIDLGNYNYPLEISAPFDFTPLSKLQTTN